MGEQFSEMLHIAQELTLKAGTIIFEGETSPEARTWIYEQDVKVNGLERQIRKQVIAHLSLSQNTLDLPYCLLLMSLVKDVERIGDYSKNLAEISDFRPGPLPEDEIGTELREIRAGVEKAFERLANVLEESDQEEALELIRRGKNLARQAKTLITKIAASDHDPSTVTALTLCTRHYKRVGGHVLNILSSVVMPLHKVDYYDEDSVLVEPKR
jgi:phosphate uptake regulator